MGLTSLFETSLHISTMIQKFLLDGYEKKQNAWEFSGEKISQYQKIEQFGGIMLSMFFFKFFFGSHSQLKYWKKVNDWIQTFGNGL